MISDELEKAIKVLEEKVPKLDPVAVDKLNPILEQLKDRKKGLLKQGYQGNPFKNSKMIKDIRDLLTIAQQLLVPLVFQAEIQKMKNLKNMVKSREENK